MKKLIALLLVLIMLAAFAACGNTGEPDDQPNEQEGQNTDEGEGSVDLDDIGKDTDTIYGSLSLSEKQAMKQAAASEGIEIDFGADGNTTFTYPDGTIVIQHGDGSYTYKDSDGSSGHIGAGWPKNEFTDLVPKPKMAILMTSTENDSFTVVFSESDIESIMSYAQELRNAGFVKDENTEKLEYEGGVSYTFSASNGQGIEVELYYSIGIGGLNINKQ